MRHNKPRINSIFQLGGMLLLAIGMSQTAKADYRSTVLSQNPVAYYPLQETTIPVASHPTNSGTLGAAADGTYVSLPSLALPGPFAGSSTPSI